jgi:hypothetical protein
VRYCIRGICGESAGLDRERLGTSQHMYSAYFRVHVLCICLCSYCVLFNIFPVNFRCVREIAEFSTFFVDYTKD